MEELVPEAVKEKEEKEEKEMEAAVVEMAEVVRPEREPGCGMIWGMRRQ